MSSISGTVIRNHLSISIDRFLTLKITVLSFWISSSPKLKREETDETGCPGPEVSHSEDFSY